MKVGLRDELIALLVSDATLIDESFLVPFSEILSSMKLRKCQLASSY